MSVSLIVGVLAALPVLAVAFHIYANKRSKGLPLPPGPKGHFIFGNLLQIPSVTPWKTFHEWSKIYGELPLSATADTVCL